ASTDIHHQPLAFVIGQGVGHAEVDQAGLLAAGDDVHPVADDLLCPAQEVGPVAGNPQGTGRDDAHGAGRQTIDHLGEPPQTVQPALHRVFGQVVVLVQTGGQLNLLAQPLDDAHFTMVNPGQHHVEAVG